MGKPTGFLEYKRELPGTKDPGERVNDFKEFYLPFSEENTRKQAARCMDCGVPFCHKGCPLGNHIPDFNDAVYREDWEGAIEILLSTNPFPEFTGRICPAPCEGSCVLGINRPAVAIEHIEKTIVEKAFELGYIQANPPKVRSGRKVAVVGSGPAGLGAATVLNQAGHQVTVFERDSQPGGLLRFGIPDFKLEKWVVERRVKHMEEEGITFQCNAHVGVNVPTSDLKAFDAVVLTGGSTVPRNLDIPGRQLEGVHFAMDYLTRQNKKVSGEWNDNMKEIDAYGKKVVVIGGGDTGADCVGTANRQGAESVVQLELLEKPPAGRTFDNPWPEWPMILRTSSSHEEGCERQWSVLTQEFIEEEGKLKGIKVVEIAWRPFGHGFDIVPGTEQVIECDLALLAIGFLHPEAEGMLADLGVVLTSRGNVNTDEGSYATSAPNVFAAGDMRRGQSLVVWAIAEGRDCANEVNEYLASEQ